MGSRLNNVPMSHLCFIYVKYVDFMEIGNNKKSWSSQNLHNKLLY